MNLPGYTINCQCTLVLLFCVSFSLTLDLNLSSKNFYNLDSTIRATHHPANGTIRFNNEQLNKHAILHTALGLKGKSYPIYASTYSIDYKFQFLIREFENLICAYHLSRKSSNCTTDLNVPTIKAIRIAESVIMIVRSTPQSRSGTTTHSLIQFVESLETFKPLKFYQDLKLMIPPHFNLIVQSIEQLGGFQFILFDRVSFLKSLIILFINGTSQNNYPQKPESIAYSLPFATKGGQFLQFNGIKYLYVYTHEKESEIIRFKLQDLDKLFRKSWQACREEKLGVEKGIKLIDFQSFVLDPQNLRPCDGRSQIPMIMDYTFNDKAINEGIVNAHGLIWLFFGAKIRQKFFFTWHNDRVYRCSDSQLIECDYVWSDEKSDDDEYPLFNSYRIDRIEGKLEVTSFKLEKGQSSEDRKTFPYKIKVHLLNCALFDECLPCELYGQSIGCLWIYDNITDHSSCKLRVEGDSYFGSACFSNNIKGKAIQVNQTAAAFNIDFPEVNFKDLKLIIRFDCHEGYDTYIIGQVFVVGNQRLKIVVNKRAITCSFKLSVELDGEGGVIRANILILYDLNEGGKL